MQILLKFIFMLLFFLPLPFQNKKRPIPAEVLLMDNTFDRGFRKEHGSEIDNLVGDPKLSKSEVIYGALEVRDILTKSEGGNSMKKGAVLEVLGAVRYASLMMGNETFSSHIEGNIQVIFYVIGGEGSINTEGAEYSVQEGSCVLIPPSVDFTIKNTGIETLTMFMIEDPIIGNTVPRKNVLVKSDYDYPLSTQARRANFPLFSRRDGLSSISSIDPVIYEPGSYVPPHVHFPGDEEIWVMIDDINAVIGSEKFYLTPGSAYKAPADGKTPHVNINPAPVSKKLLWIYSSSPKDSSKKYKKRKGDSSPRI